MKDSFPSRPVVRSLKQMNEATALIVHYRQMRRRAEMDLETALENVRRQHAKHFLVETPNGPMAISTRLEQLETQVSRYTEKHTPHIFRAGPLDTATATVAPFHAAGGIEFRDGHNRRTVAQQYAAVEGFRDAINRLLKRFKLLGRIILTPDLDWDGLKRDLRAGELTPEDIEPLGMIWTGGPKAIIRTKRKSK